MSQDASRVIRSFRPSGPMFPMKAVPAVLGSFVFAYVCQDLISNRKIFGGTTPRTMTPEWIAETERRYDEGWPRTASENPVVMNPISRRNWRKVE
ncbi:uncharacterized protein LOC112350857 [Selaginella moellendorffii]|uniref:uncharacterized protein LOC112350857 n=1 Tax=Selaginella moellendorffii TaxID=88036 RepID=UPI000D1CD454|nr:uncharacterized protein LOC112350857 [Selaginella moellendorffii]|eukprot:XP_024543592.1 uncharacterized protein LOC112350857 [Selaginella moellendorffii]